MYKMYPFHLLVLLSLVPLAVCNFNDQVSLAITSVDTILGKIHDRWKIDQYPNFLKSVAMSHTSWEILKLKFQSKFLKAFFGSNEKFVIGFMGSSVTAGHDSPFNVSFPILTGILMEPAFSPFGIKLESRNSAMGNNPCLPYDLCPRTFAGPDADIVHWEQSFNCFGSDQGKRHVFEQFVRQSLSLPNQPVVVLSSSDTPNWKESDCDGKDTKSPHLSEGESALLRLLSTEPNKIASEANKEELPSRWSALADLFRSYKVAGIQMWSHGHYDSYRCRGPYVRDWGCCSASWHPSLLGHELRAAHYSYFWLLIYRDALRELQKDGLAPEELRTRVSRRIESEHKYIPSKQLYPTSFPDDLRCLTTYEPRHDPEAHLLDYVISNGDPRPPFAHAIFEEFIAKDVLTTARKRGYKDFKYMFYGNKNSSPLSFRIKIQKRGNVWLCQPPGNWGALPKGFKNFWEVNTEVYLSSQNLTNFTFDANHSQKLKYVNHFPKDTQNICVEIQDQIDSGNHILTLVSNSEEKIMFSYLILP